MKSDNRYLGAAIIAPFILFIFLGGIYLKGFIFAISIMAIGEFYNAIIQKEFNPIKYAGYLLLILYYWNDNNFESIMYILVAVIFILLIVPVFCEKYTFVDISLTILAFIYAGIFFSSVYLVSTKMAGNWLIWLIFISSWLSDTAAYYSGKSFGKHKLCPKVSPKKTIEGSVGGMLGSVIFCFLFGIVINKYYSIIPMYHYLIIGAVCGIFGQVGDLVASSVKRYVGIKDYSNLIPGHGGILDRFDSVIFSSTVLFYYLTFVLKI